MPKDKGLASHIIASSDLVMLRRWLASDMDHYVRWWTQGEWLLLNAPWEGDETSMTGEEDRRTREWFVQQLNGGDQTWLNRRAAIAAPDNTPLGWVSRYGEKDNPQVRYVGIDVCEDAYLNRGLGTEALRLWVDYLFATSDVHRLGLETWSFNPRMIRVAEKVGLVYEGRQREVRLWQGEWLDLVLFGILREEWKASGNAGCSQT